MMGSKDEGPRRIQLSRRKGWRMPENTVSCARPGIWGNQHVVVLDEIRHTGDFDEQGEPIMEGPWLCKIQPDRISGWWFATKAEATAKAIALFRWDLTENPTEIAAIRRCFLPEIQGKNLGCWCGLCDRHKDGKPLAEHCADCAPCHTDVLGELLASPDPNPSPHHTKGGL